ncbi:MAG: hypothetical protein AAFX87_25880 [Bacteroidota bacterium]
MRKNVLRIAFHGYLEAKNLIEAQSQILMQIEKSPQKVIVELKPYEKIDFSFIQLLLTLKKDLQGKKLDLEFNLDFSEEDASLLSRLNIINLL